MKKAHRRLSRLPMLAAGMTGLIAALWGGLVRVGWEWPVPQPMWVAIHGPLMIAGFLGTLICLERAVGYGALWSYLGPVFAAIGCLLMVAGFPPFAAPGWFAVASAVVLCAVYAVVFFQNPTRHMAVMGVGALFWMTGNILLVRTWAVYQIVLWWAAFLIFTIVGERLELNRFLKPGRWSWPLFLTPSVLVGGGLILTLAQPDAGARIVGAGFTGLAVWLAFNDIVRRTIRIGGLPKFVAWCLLGGFGWLAVSGLMLLRYGAPVPGPWYDITLHSLFVGFVFSMIFGHAPIIFPAVLELRIEFSRLSYVPLALLNISLAMRLTGDLLQNEHLRRCGALLNALSIVLFLLLTVKSLRPAPEAAGMPSPPL